MCHWHVVGMAEDLSRLAVDSETSQQRTVVIIDQLYAFLTPTSTHITPAVLGRVQQMLWEGMVEETELRAFVSQSFMVPKGDLNHDHLELISKSPQ